MKTFLLICGWTVAALSLAGLVIGGSDGVSVFLAFAILSAILLSGGTVADSIDKLGDRLTRRAP